jgi:hypothetical protein
LNNEGHDVGFYDSQAEGCCDCSNPDEWDPSGFCPHHGPASASQNLGGPLSGEVIQQVQGVVPAMVDWMVQTMVKVAEEGHLQAQAAAAAIALPLVVSLPIAAAAEVLTVDNTTTQQEEEEDLTHHRMMQEEVIFNPDAAGSIKLKQAGSDHSTTGGHNQFLHLSRWMPSVLCSPKNVP